MDLPARTPIHIAADLPCDEQGRPIFDLYARMSDGFDGKELNIEGQFAAAERYVGFMGGVVGERLSDPVSAWLPNVERPGWERLVERMRTRQSAGASIWNIDRFLRQNRQLEQLLDAVDQMGCRLIDGSGERKLDNEDDRFVLRIMVSQANKSSADTSRRVREKFRLQRESGYLNDAGPRAFAWPGLEPTKPGQKRRREVSPEKLKAEREALQWAFEHIAEGGSLTEVAEKWNGQGLFSFYGRPWDKVKVRQTMMRQRYAGRIEHKGQAVGVIADHKPTIDPELFDRVQTIFASRRLGRPAGQKSLGSGILRCGGCGTALLSRPRYLYSKDRKTGKVERVTVPQYKCSKDRGGCGRAQVDQEPADAMLRAFVVERLADPRVADEVAAIQGGQSAEMARVQAELETARRAEAGLAAKLKAKRISWDVFSDLQDGIFSDIERLEARLKELEAASTDLEAVQTRSRLAVAEEWDKKTVACDIEGLRKLIRDALPPRLVRVEVRRATEVDEQTGESRRVPPMERIRLVKVGVSVTPS